jgi:WD40 repeat protein
MADPQAESNLYTVGGTVQAGGGAYLQRNADDELFNLCLARIFAYVLTPRQMGKSSLMVHTAQRLVDEGIQSVIIDLTQIGVQATAEEWYLGLLTLIEDQLMLDTDVLSWWQANAHLGITLRLTQFFQDIILEEMPNPIVVFVDEIDTTLSLSFTDDFFAAIRYFYLARARQPAFHRLSFVLIGVATPSDLIRDPQRTPFNIGQRVDLTDFSFEEALPLAQGLGLPDPEAQQVLRWVLSWTGGHPYLTQRLYQALKERQQTHWTESQITEAVQNTFLGTMSQQDTNLQFVRDMLTKRAPDIMGVLTTYQEVLRGRSVLDEEQSLIKSHLKLSGVVRREGDTLQVRNSIYQKVFDLVWVKEHLPINWSKRLRRIGIAAGLVFLILQTPLAIWADMQRREAIAARDDAEVQRQEAVTAREETERQRQEAVTAREEAERQRTMAEQSARNAQGQRQLAEKRRVEAETARGQEVQQRQLAQQSEQEAQRQAERAQGQATLAETRRLEADSARREEERQRRIAQRSEKEARITSRISSAYERLASNSELPAMLEILNAAKQLQALERTNKVDAGFRMTVVAGLRRVLGQVKEVNRLEVEEESAAVTSVSFHPNDPTMIASTYENGTVRLWHPDGTLLKQFDDLANWSNHITFSPDGTVMAGNLGNTVGLFELDGTLRTIISGHNSSVTSISFSGDGRTLASASTRGQVLLTDLAELPTTSVTPILQSSNAVLTNEDPIWEPTGNPYDEYDLEGQSGQRVIITLQGDEFAAELSVLDDSGQTISSTYYSGSNTFLSVTLPKDGIYRVVVSADSSEAERAYQLAVLPTFEETDVFNPWGNSASSNVYLADMSISPDGETIATVAETTEGDTNEPIAASSDSTSVSSTPNEPITPPANPTRIKAQLWRRDNATLITTLEGHNADVTRIRFSPDGDTIATASEDNTVRLWQSDGTWLGTLEGHSDDVTSINFSPDGQTLVTASAARRENGFFTNADNTVRFWRQDGTLINTLEGHSSAVTGVSFSPTGEAIATASTDGAVRLWRWNQNSIEALGDVRATSDDLVFDVRLSPTEPILASAGFTGIKLWDSMGRLIKTLGTESHTGLIRSVSFSPDGSTIATASDDRTVRLWDRQGNPIGEPWQLESEVSSVVFSPTGDAIATASDDRTVRLWNRQGNLIWEAQLEDSASSLAFTTDGQIITTVSGGSTVQSWDRQGNQIGQPLQLGASRNSRSVVSTDGQTFATLGSDNTVQLWDRQGNQIGQFQSEEEISSIVFTPDGDTLATINNGNGIVQFWSRQGNLVGRLVTGEGISSVLLSADGQTIVTTSPGETFEKDTVRLWQRNGILINSFEVDSISGSAVLSSDGQTIAVVRNNSVKLLNRDGDLETTLGLAFSKVRFSPDGQIIAGAGLDHKIHLWHRDGTPIETLEGHSSEIWALSFSPDGQIIASGDLLDTTVRLWSRDGTPLQVLSGHRNGITDISFSSDSQIIASASLDNTVRLWRRDGTFTKELLGHSGGVVSVSFNPNGQTLASGSEDGTVRLWQRNGDPIGEPLRHGGRVWAVDVGWNGNVIASAGADDNIIKLWRPDGTLVTTLTGHTDSVRGLGFSADGFRLASASFDSTVILWNLDIDNLLARNCAWIHGYLANNPNLTEENYNLCPQAAAQRQARQAQEQPLTWLWDRTVGTIARALVHQ